MCNKMTEEFTLVKGKKAAKRYRTCNTKSYKPGALYEEGATSLSKDAIASKVEKLREELRDSLFYEGVKDTLEKANIPYLPIAQGECLRSADGKSHIKEGQEEVVGTRSVVCYGLGSIGSCLIAQYQLALCLLLRDEIKVSTRSLIYDPVFTETEREVLIDFNFEILQQNEEGVRRPEHPTLFYMPHCGKPLYNNLLWANWQREKLPHLVIVGNSFQHIVDSTSSRILKKEAEYIEKIQPYTSEWNLRNNFKHEDIFNNTSVHIFSDLNLSQLPDTFWDVMSRPSYDEDVEIILNK